MAIKLDVGLQPFNLEFSNGQKTTIYFNPADLALAERLSCLFQKVEQRFKTIADDVRLKPDGTPEKDSEEFRAGLAAMYEEIDKAFGNPISEEVFRYCSPFALVKGERFVFRFIEAIKPEIEKRIKQERKKEQELMSEYLAKYKK